MEIPRPRLKGLQEIDAEEKVAEKAVLAIRRKTLQVDTDIERIREEVEGELDRLDTQRSSLEQGMQTLMEEQALILSALSELEDRQTRHKQNLSMLKDEEIEIESERKSLNSALKQLRSRQRAIKEMVGKKFSPFESMKMKGRLSGQDDFSFGREKWGYSNEGGAIARWGAKPQNEGQEPKIKIISPASLYASGARPDLDLAKSNDDAAFNSGSDNSKFLAQHSSAKANLPISKKPSILGRIRSATDKYLPEPFRKNKPTIAILEEKAENAESAQVLESYSSKSDELGQALPQKEAAKDVSPPKTPLGNYSIPLSKKSAGQQSQALQPGPKGASLENEISQFEEKLTLMDDGQGEPQFQAPKSSGIPQSSGTPQSNDFKSRISSIVHMNKNAPASAQMASNAQNDASKQNSNPSLQLPRMGVYNYNQAPLGAGPSHLPQLGASPSLPQQASAPRYSHHNSVGALNAASKLYVPTQNDHLAKTKSEIVRKLTTEAKLARLHSKLSEMKSALKSLSKNDEGDSLETKNPIQRAANQIRKSSAIADAPMRKIIRNGHSKAKFSNSRIAKSRSKSSPSKGHSGKKKR